MPDLQDIQALMETIQDAVPVKSKKSDLLYVNRFEAKATQMPLNEISWVVNEEDYGIAPIVSSMQNSPVAPQGTYGQWKSGGIETRHVKPFTREELDNLLTPDAKKRINAAHHIEREAINSAERQYRLIEYVAHCVTARGSLTYLTNEANNRKKVSMTFPILTKTATATWATISNDIIGMMEAWLDQYSLVGNGRPKAIRMTTKVWRYIRDNTAIKTYINNVLRIGKGEFSGGIVTPAIVSDAFNWPPIEIYDERCPLEFTVLSAVTGGAGAATITLKDGTFGLNVGDEIIVGYNSTKGTYTKTVAITTVNDGVSIVTAALGSGVNLAADEKIHAKPYFFPSNKILFVPDENSSNNIEFVRMPFGISVSGNDVQVLDRYGIYIDAFAGSVEPDLVVFKRFWDRFAFRINPRAYCAATVVV